MKITVITADRERFSAVTIVDRYMDFSEAEELLSSAPDTVGFDSEGDGRLFLTNNLHIIQLHWDDEVVLFDCVTLDYSLLAGWINERTLVIHHALNDLPFLYKKGIFPKGVHCTYLAEKVLSMGKKKGMGIEDLSLRYGTGDIDKSNKGKILYEVNDDAIRYCVDDVRYLLAIHDMQAKQAEKERCTRAIVIEDKFVPVLAYFSWCGVHIDAERWDKVVEYNASLVDGSIKDLDEFVFRNFKNRKKLCAIDMQGDLFDGFKQTKTCLVKWNYDQSVAMLMAECDDKQLAELADLITAYKSNMDISKTYGKYYTSCIAQDRRIHPKYNQLGITGRISCPRTMLSSKGYELPAPSFMDLPKEGLYRQSVTAEEGNVLVCADWSAFEVCIAACTSRDKAMMAACNDGKPHDGVFLAAQSKNTGKPWYQIAYDNRKRLNIAFINGITEYGIANMLGIDKGEADILLTSYQKTYGKFLEYQLRLASMANTDKIMMNDMFGYCYAIEEYERMKTCSKFTDRKGMKLYYNSRRLSKSDPFVKQMDWYFAEYKRLSRLAISGRMQNMGTVIFKYACASFFKKIKEKGLLGTVKMIIPQHDSITVECPEQMKDEVLDMLVKSMDSASSTMLGGFVIPIKSYISNDYR